MKLVKYFLFITLAFSVTNSEAMSWKKGSWWKNFGSKGFKSFNKKGFGSKNQWFKNFFEKHNKKLFFGTVAASTATSYYLNKKLDERLQTEIDKPIDLSKIDWKGLNKHSKTHPNDEALSGLLNRVFDTATSWGSLNECLKNTHASCLIDTIAAEKLEELIQDPEKNYLILRILQEQPHGKLRQACENNLPFFFKGYNKIHRGRHIPLVYNEWNDFAKDLCEKNPELFTKHFIQDCLLSEDFYLTAEKLLGAAYSDEKHKKLLINSLQSFLSTNQISDKKLKPDDLPTLIEVTGSLGKKGSFWNTFFDLLDAWNGTDNAPGEIRILLAAAADACWTLPPSVTKDQCIKLSRLEEGKRYVSAWRLDPLWSDKVQTDIDKLDKELKVKFLEKKYKNVKPLYWFQSIPKEWMDDFLSVIDEPESVKLVNLFEEKSQGSFFITLEKHNPDILNLIFNQLDRYISKYVSFFVKSYPAGKIFKRAVEQNPQLLMKACSNDFENNFFAERDFKYLLYKTIVNDSGDINGALLKKLDKKTRVSVLMALSDLEHLTINFQGFFQTNPEYGIDLLHYGINNASIRIRSLESLIRRCIPSQIRQGCIVRSDRETLMSLIKLYLVTKICKLKINFESKSQTENHIKQNIYSVIDSLLGMGYEVASGLRDIDYRLVKKAEELEKEGYVTFVHGQRFSYLIAEEWFTRLYNLRQGKSVDEFIFPHVRGIFIDEQKESHIRKFLLQCGITSDADRSYLLFMNWALFANASNFGSNTTYYTTKNSNVGPVYATLNDAFTRSGYAKVYKKYEKELKALEQEFIKLSRYGNKFLIAVPKDKLKDMVYLAKPGGYKDSMFIDDFDKTDDISLMMETLRNNPEKITNTDRVEFCLIQTADKKGALNPDSGVKYFPFFVADEEKLKEFRKKEQELFDKMKNDLDMQTDRLRKIDPVVKLVTSTWKNRKNSFNQF